MAEEKERHHSGDPSVFLSYVGQDAVTAQLLALRLQDAGVRVWSPDKIKAGEIWMQALEGQLRASDYIIVLISQRALKSEFMQREMTFVQSLQELSDRDITVIPILLEDVELPASFRDIQHFDLRRNLGEEIDALVARVSTTITVDLSDLSPLQFQNLVADLLVERNVRVEAEVEIDGTRFDFRVHHQVTDPFGADMDEVWYIEVKHYKSARLSVDYIRQYASLAYLHHRNGVRVALVTSSQITSAGRAAIDRAPIRVIEGVELKRLLLSRSDLVKKYFGARRS